MTTTSAATNTQTHQSIRCSAAASTAASLHDAISTAYQEALVELGGSSPDLVVVFISAAYGEEIRPAMESLNELAPSRYLLGTTAEAVLANNDEYESEPAIAILSLPGERARARRLENLTVAYVARSATVVVRGRPSDAAAGRRRTRVNK